MTFKRYGRLIVIVAGMATIIAPCFGRPQVDVLTQHNDNYRSGANTQETILNTSNVNVSTFGKLFARKVDGYIYAQPLYVSGLKINGHNHNVVFVATEHNTVYAFDADDPAASTPVWSTNLGASVPSSDLDGGPGGKYLDLTPEIGITGTPVIDLKSKTLFVVAKTKMNDSYALKLHGLDIATGFERDHSPVEIKPTVRGVGDGSVDGFVTLEPLKHFNRPGLLLSDGVVYVALGSHADFPPYHGWVVGYDAATLQQVSVFNSTPNGAAASFWSSGNGLMADDQGYVWALSGNGTFDANTGGSDYGNTFLKLKPGAAGLSLVDWMTPWNQEFMNVNDLDLGSSGAVFIPDTPPPSPTGRVAESGIVIGGGKSGVLYVLDASKPGQYHVDHDDIIQAFRVTPAHIHGSPVYWHGPNGLTVYLWPEREYLQAYSVQQRRFQVDKVTRGPVRVPNGMPGGFLSVSSDGEKLGTSIVWAMRPYSGNANQETRPGVVEAFDASDVTHMLWSSRQNLSRDDISTFAKMSAPTIANGKVYVPTFSGQLMVYGLLPKGK